MSRSSYLREMTQALPLTLDHLERLRAIKTAEIIGAASGDTEAIAVTHNADKAAVSFPTFHCRFNFVF
jgi:hypothetical protein